MTELKDAVQKVADILYRNGDICDFGVEESLLPKMVELAQNRYPHKKIRAVKQWMWWDYDIPVETCAKFSAAGVQPAIVFSTYLIWDSSGQWEEGWNVKTTPLVTFEENCFFITRNTVYILVGQGHRKRVDPAAASSIYF